MYGININDLTIKQYLRLTQENQTLSMVKKVDDMTIAEYIEYEERIKGQYNRNSRSYFPTYFCHGTSNNNTILECPRNAYFNPIPLNTKFNYDSEDIELDEEAGYTTDEESVMNASNNVMPRSIYEYLKLDNLREATTSIKMDDMTQRETLGMVKNVLVKINKFEFPCDFVVTNMPETLGEMIILGRPFLEPIHAQINVFQEEVSLGIGEDRIKFDAKENPCQSNILIE
uniref:Reverse transcriptase domain-containing protein n=1 Tax=Tanacetum cinerariifolium TaxID=118510 RepID=A0A6L2MC16_TANCI|nr:hypothetical protein [Tanacetum cinerariifolium]